MFKHMWPWSNKAHLAFKYIDKLWKLSRLVFLINLPSLVTLASLAVACFKSASLLLFILLNFRQ